ncbi:hypothetical protein GQ457_10G029470 [Hibiscus cannabinus]
MENNSVVGDVEKKIKSSSAGEENLDFIAINKGENQRHVKQEDDISTAIKELVARLSFIPMEKTMKSNLSDCKGQNLNTIDQSFCS